MSEDIVRSALFYFFCGSLDALTTIIVLFTGIGYEGNPLWNWISPTEHLAIAIVLGNLAIGTIIILSAHCISTHTQTFRTVVKCGLYGEGLGRVVFGFIPGVLLMKQSGLI